jgi:hypothetical protein
MTDDRSIRGSLKTEYVEGLMTLTGFWLEAVRGILLTPAFSRRPEVSRPHLKKQSRASFFSVYREHGASRADP